MKNSRAIIPSGRVTAFSLTLLLAIFFGFNCKAQKTFHRLYNVGSGSLWYLAFSTTLDHGAVAAFHRAGGSALTLGLVKVDEGGKQIWTKSFAVTTNATAPVSMSPTPDSGVVVTLIDATLMNSILLMKLDKNGNAIWSKSFPAVYYNTDAFPVFVKPDGSVLFAHSDNDSLCLKKITAGGQLVWAKNFRRTGNGIISPSALLFHDSGIYIGGYDADSYSAFLVKTDSTGNIIWKKEKAGALSAKLNLLPVATGGIILSTVPISATPAFSRVAFIRPDASVKWSVEVPFTQPQMSTVGPATFGLSFLEQKKVKTVIIDTLGTVKGARSSFDSAADLECKVVGDKRGGFWICGINGLKLWMIRSDTTGNSGCLSQTETVAAQAQTIQPVDMSLVATVSAPLFTDYSFTGQPLFVSDSIICSTLSAFDVTAPQFSYFPNPVTGSLVIKRPLNSDAVLYRLVSTDGAVAANGTLLQGETILPMSGFSPGLYFLSITGDRGLSTTVKLMKH